MTKRFLKALRREPVDRPPFWIMRQAGRYLPEYREVRAKAKNFLDFCYTPDRAVEVTLQPLRRYHMDAAILFSDILVIPHALGQNVAFVEGEGPVLDPIRTIDGFKNLNPENVMVHLEPVFETVRHLSQAIPKETALIGFAGSPWTVATYMVEGRGKTGFPVILEMARNDPDTLQVLIDLLVESTAAYLEEQIKNGAEAVQIFDSWAGVFAKDEDLFRRFVIEPNRAIVKRLEKDFARVPVIGFPRGAGNLYETFAKETGVAGIGIDETVDVVWARDVLQPLCAVQGNLDNQLLVKGGDAMDKAVRHILETLSGGPFIFNLGHGVVPETPPENVERLAGILRNWKN